MQPDWMSMVSQSISECKYVGLPLWANNSFFFLDWIVYFSIHYALLAPDEHIHSDYGGRECECTLGSSKLHDEINRSERIWCYLRAVALSSRAHFFFFSCFWQICANAMMPSRIRCKRCVQNWCWRKRGDIIHVYSGRPHVCHFMSRLRMSIQLCTLQRHCLAIAIVYPSIAQ